MNCQHCNANGRKQNCIDSFLLSLRIFPMRLLKSELIFPIRLVTSQIKLNTDTFCCVWFAAKQQS